MAGKPGGGFSFFDSSANFEDYGSFESSFPSFTGQQQESNYNQFSFNYSQEDFQRQADEPSQDSNWEYFNSNYYYYYPYSYSYEPAVMYGHTESKIEDISEVLGDLVDGWEHQIQDCVYEGIVTTEDDELLDQVICEVKRVVSTENLTDPLLFYFIRS